jgi:hypothetical protein
MKYIHSMWSAPAMKNDFDIDFLLRNFYLYLLSVLLIKKHGYCIDLYCDKQTYDIYSMIPYDNIHVIDFSSDGVSKIFWIWAKIKAQMLVDEPYVHIDGDVLMFRDIIGDKLESGQYSAVVQSTENQKTIGDWYDRVYVNTTNPYLKWNNKYNIDWNKYDAAYNCGVIGFNDMKLKHQYLNTVKNLLVDLSNDPTFQYDGNKYGGIFMLTEQTYLYNLLNENKVKPLEVIPLEEIEKCNYDWYFKVPKNLGYCHMLGTSKYKPFVTQKIKTKIRNYFPQYLGIIEEFEKKYK